MHFGGLWTISALYGSLCWRAGSAFSFLHPLCRGSLLLRWDVTPPHLPHPAFHSLCSVPVCVVYCLTLVRFGSCMVPAPTPLQRPLPPTSGRRPHQLTLFLRFGTVLADVSIVLVCWFPNVGLRLRRRTNNFVDSSQWPLPS